MADLFLDIEYDVKTDKVKVANTNIKTEALPEILEAYLHTQMGAGKDERKPEEREQYHIRLELDLDGDVFTSYSDTGNKGLRDGILMHALQQLS